jgi:putative aldouronate transport system substrate-binding protein
MFDVVMGADISVWDRAVARWKADGGDQITKEVNDWYQSVGGN